MNRHVTAFVIVACVVGATVVPSWSEGRVPGCPPAMALVAGLLAKPYCIDRWEASVVEVQGRREVVHSPYEPVTHARVKAVSRPGVVPQGYIAKTEAEAACHEARKRLCTSDEWVSACRGRKPSKYPYGDERKEGYCNDSGRAPFASLYPELGEQVFASSAAMNDPRINRSPNTVAKTGQFARCRNSFGVFDMVGNLHEWTADVNGTRGVFRGGYYQDTHINGDGCDYKTVAHDVTYHDYSTGFRCCTDAR
jgi:sulfatase modifying factor 1